ncbi:hypothetical protein P8X24_06335 [Pyrococcus kukulkanii]|uniref:hypothetical protein n=1 Tax=Pyrococcus kukulkanii TaxID=1609559 RepID=UPI003562B5CA
MAGLTFPISDVITIVEDEKDWKDVAVGLAADFAGGAVVAVIAGTNPISLSFVATFLAGAATTEYVIKPLGTFIWDLWGNIAWGISNPGAGENDNNSVAGG